MSRSQANKINEGDKIRECLLVKNGNKRNYGRCERTKTKTGKLQYWNMFV